MPSISVIVPVYQAQSYIQNCIACVQKQTFEDWELLLVDDASQDGSGVLCDRAAKSDSRIRVFHLEKNSGVSTARNLGLQEAKGETIAFLDADDCFELQALETMWQMRRQAKADTAACAHWNWYSNGKQTPELLLPAGIYHHEDVREGIVNPLTGDRLQSPVFNGFIWRYLFSADIIRKNRITFEGAYLEDELFLIEYFCHADSLAVTDQPLYRYFLNPNSVTHRYMADYMEVFTRFMERKTALVDKYHLAEDRPQWRETSNWAGLLIAIGNEYSKSNPASARQKQKTVQAICQRPEMAHAIRTIKPVGLSGNKQIVATLVRGKHYFTLTQLYRIKNRM